MITFYTNNVGEIYTEEEAREEAYGIVERNDYYIEKLQDYPYGSIWDMLTEEAKERIFDEAVQEIIDEEYNYREFTEEELKSILGKFSK